MHKTYVFKKCVWVLAKTNDYYICEFLCWVGCLGRSTYTTIMLCWLIRKVYVYYKIWRKTLLFVMVLEKYNIQCLFSAPWAAVCMSCGCNFVYQMPVTYFWAFHEGQTDTQRWIHWKYWNFSSSTSSLGVHYWSEGSSLRCLIGMKLSGILIGVNNSLVIAFGINYCILLDDDLYFRIFYKFS